MRSRHRSRSHTRARTLTRSRHRSRSRTRSPLCRPCSRPPRVRGRWEKGEEQEGAAKNVRLAGSCRRSSEGGTIQQSKVSPGMCATSVALAEVEQKAEAAAEAAVDKAEVGRKSKAEIAAWLKKAAEQRQAEAAVAKAKQVAEAQAALERHAAMQTKAMTDASSYLLWQSKLGRLAATLAAFQAEGQRETAQAGTTAPALTSLPSSALPALWPAGQPALWPVGQGQRVAYSLSTLKRRACVGSSPFSQWGSPPFGQWGSQPFSQWGRGSGWHTVCPR